MTPIAKMKLIRIGYPLALPKMKKMVPSVRAIIEINFTNQLISICRVVEALFAVDARLAI